MTGVKKQHCKHLFELLMKTGHIAVPISFHESWQKALIVNYSLLQRCTITVFVWVDFVKGFPAERTIASCRKRMPSFICQRSFREIFNKKVYSSTYQALSLGQGSIHIWIHIFQVPLEAFAFEPLPQLNLLGEVADVNDLFIQQVVVPVTVEKVLVLIQPDLCHPGQVTLHCLLPVLREFVRILSPEDVSHPGAGDDLNFPSAHPDLFICST